MKTMFPSGRASRAVFRRPIVAFACAVAVPWLALSPAAMGGTATVSSAAAVLSTAAASSTPVATATLEQCATATIPQTERSATFAGEMTAIPGTARMEMRIDLQERGLEEPQYRTVSAPGLSVWHSSTAGVKIFAHIQQVTDLSAPASYRGAVRFRWVNARGRLIKAEELRTARCEQPAASPASGTSSSTATTSAGAASA